jgi:TRAP-type C4-dicarboxylate transport system permease large subunit
VLKDSAFQTGAIMFIVTRPDFRLDCHDGTGCVVVYDLVIHFVTQKWAVLLLVNIVLLAIGCLIEGIAAIMITVPVLLPVMQKFGVDPTHFGVFLCINILIGLLTPPLGMAVYISSDLAQVPVMETFRKSAPFLIPLLVTLLLVTYIPEITLFIPNLLFK